MRDQKTLLEIDIVLALVDAEFHQKEGRLDEAVKTIDNLLHLLNRSGARYFLPEALRLKAEILLSQGEGEDAYAVLLEARRAATEISFRPHLWQILASLAKIADQRGELVQAKTFREEATPIVQWILDHTSEPEYQSSFSAFVLQEGVGGETG